MADERVSGILTEWKLVDGEPPALGEPFTVLEAVWDFTGAEPIRTILRIKRPWNEERRGAVEGSDG
jgi:hypothetical protein